MSVKAIPAIWAAALLAAATALTGCGSSSDATPKPLSSSSGPSHPEWSSFTFTIGDNGGDGTEALSKITGAFDSAPYKVKFARFDYGPPLVQAASSGDIDLGYVGDVPPITGAAKQAGFSIVGVAHRLDPTVAPDNILVPKGSPLQTAAQLRGKTIAVPQGSSAHGLVLLALKRAGLRPNDVRLVFTSPAAGSTAFSSGKVDAWAIWNPQSALAVQQGARILVEGLPPVDQTNNYYVASDKTLDDPVKRAALSDAFQRLAHEFAWASTHPDQLARAVSEEAGISIADATSVISSYQFRFTPVTSTDIDVEQTLSDAFVEAGQISKKVDVSKIVRNILPPGYDSSKLANS